MLFFIKTFGIFKKKSYLCGLKYAVNFTIMKTNWKKSIVLTILLSFVLMPNAWAFQYKYQDNTLEYTIIDNVNKYVSVSAGEQLANSTLVIPNQVTYDGKTYTVTQIDSAGFYDKPEIVSLTLPNTIKNIGFKAFAHCINLRNLVLSSDIVTLNNQTFYGCTSLTNITFNGDVETLGDQTFYECSSLTSINFIGKVNTIGNQAFYQCNNLTSINFNQNTPPTLNLRKITNEANFSKIIFTIPNNTINAYVQSWSSLLPHIYEKSNNVFYTGGLIYTKTNDTEVSVRWGCGSGMLNIGNSITHKKYAKEYNITSVETKAFYKTSYTSIQLGKNIKRINQQAFARITGMNGKTIEFPSALVYIGNDAFLGCASTYEFTSNELPELGEEVFDIFSTNDSIDENDGCIKFIVPSCKVFQSITANWNYPFFTNYVYAKDKCSYNITKDEVNNFGDIPTNKSQEEFGKITYTRFFKPGVWETLYLPFELGSMLIEEVDYKDKAWKSATNPGYFYLAKLDNGTTEFEIVTDGLKGHTPYIIQFPDDPYYEKNPITFVSKYNYNIISSGWNQQTNQLTMYGNTTLQQQSITNSYYLNVESNDNNFKLATTKLNPFECYISPEQNPSSRLAIRIRPQDDVTTAIPTIDTNQLFWYRNGNSLIIQTKGQPVKIYNINGALIQSFAEGQEQITVELTSGCYIINSTGTAQKIIF